MEYADDAALPNEDVNASSRRLTHFAEKANEEAGMEINIPKTKGQHIMHNPPVSETTEADIEQFNLKFKFKCDKCDMTYPTQHGLSVHKGRWCKKRKNAKKPSRKGTVADRIVQKRKREEQKKIIQRSKLDTTKLIMFSISNILELMSQTMAILMFLFRIGATSPGKDLDSMPRP